MASARTSYFVDTNILVYAVDPAEREKRPLVSDLLRTLIRDQSLVLSAQSLNECYRVITDRRRIMAREQARGYIAALAPSCTAPFGFHVTREAWRFQDEAGFSFWDSMLLASASLGGCGVFVSEDMQHGRELGDLTIMNPFTPDFADHFSF
jgi:predicted nucleic acid-binding protein